MKPDLGYKFKVAFMDGKRIIEEMTVVAREGEEEKLSYLSQQLKKAAPDGTVETDCYAMLRTVSQALARAAKAEITGGGSARAVGLLIGMPDMDATDRNKIVAEVLRTGRKDMAKAVLHAPIPLVPDDKYALCHIVKTKTRPPFPPDPNYI